MLYKYHFQGRKKVAFFFLCHETGIIDKVKGRLVRESGILEKESVKSSEYEGNQKEKEKNLGRDLQLVTLGRTFEFSVLQLGPIFIFYFNLVLKAGVFDILFHFTLFLIVFS